MAEKMDFDSEKYVGTPYEIPARQLSLLSKQDEAPNKLACQKPNVMMHLAHQYTEKVLTNAPLQEEKDLSHVATAKTTLVH
mmetsp:Transcript_22960/g.29466  ORF Transcript_22960/g.29466 Transcript_22960/m.29466 type:complete len:81 (+) Transcript_22960:114-356(+)